MIKLNRAEYLDKLHACWIGKNIGGTLGAPYEGGRTFLDVKSFVTPAGEPLPNDDLDLQLVWLIALEQTGAKAFSTNTLAEYWLDWICPHWNEYGLAKSNLKLGLLPPMSGELDNDKWKTSNGAWIRSEIWAALAPGRIDVAIKYATMDGMVDHGIAEGTVAEIFTAALQSAAYTESDIKTLINFALSKIPTDSMVHKTVSLIIKLYNDGVDYKTAREKAVEFNRELGWFQAPINLGFVTIGLLYGEGDFKKSVLYAVNCGDDADCTGGTVAATLGIIGGTKAIPKDWQSFVGDRIITVSINGMYHAFVPKTCSELTNRVYALVESVAKANEVQFEFTDEQTCYPAQEVAWLNKYTSKDLLARAPFSYDLLHYPALDIRVELDGSPRLNVLDQREIKITFKNFYGRPHKLNLRVIAPDCIETENYQKILTVDYPQPVHGISGKNSALIKIKAVKELSAVSRVYIEATADTIPYPIVIPVIFVG